MAKTNHCIEEIRDAAGKELVVQELKPAEFDTVINILLKVFGPVTDERNQSMCTYSACDILTSGLIAILSGANTWVAIAAYVDSHAEQFIKNDVFCGSTPAHDTYGRVFGKIHGDVLQKAINAYMEEYIKAAHNYIVPEKDNDESGKKDNDDDNDDDNDNDNDNDKKIYKQLAIDGQYAKGSGRSDDSRNPTRPKGVLHVQDNYLGVTVETAKVDLKSNEIAAAQDFLKSRDLTDYIATFDALHTQKDTFFAIIDPEHREGPYKNCTGNYVAGVKENQPLLFEAINGSFTMSKIEELELTKGRYYEEIDEKRKVIRRYYMIPAPCGKDEWPGLNSFVCCIVLKNGEIQEVRYYVSSLDDVKLIADCIRKHWWVENKVHYVLDTAYEQDANTTVNHDAIRSRGIMFTFADALISLRNAIYNKKDSRKSFRTSCDLSKNNKLLGECFLPFPKKAAAKRAA